MLSSTAMMAMVIMLYAPVSSAVHAALSVFSFSLLVSPVANNATSPVNVVLALSLALLSVAVAWTLWRWRVSPSLLKHLSNMLRARRPAGERENSLASVEYTQVALEDSSHDKPQQPERRDRAGDIEMLALHSPTRQRHRLGGEERELAVVHRPAGAPLSWEEIRKLLYHSRTGFVGAIMGLLGLFFFANQTRTNYWYVHSLWHVLMMFSAYFLVRGRVDLFVGLHRLLDKEMHNIDD